MKLVLDGYGKLAGYQNALAYQGLVFIALTNSNVSMLSALELYHMLGLATTVNVYQLRMERVTKETAP